MAYDSLMRTFRAPSYTHLSPEPRQREHEGFSLEQYERRWRQRMHLQGQHVSSGGPVLKTTAHRVRRITYARGLETADPAGSPWADEGGGMPCSHQPPPGGRPMRSSRHACRLELSEASRRAVPLVGGEGRGWTQNGVGPARAGRRQRERAAGPEALRRPTAAAPEGVGARGPRQHGPHRRDAAGTEAGECHGAHGPWLLAVHRGCGSRPGRLVFCGRACALRWGRRPTGTRDQARRRIARNAE